MENLQKRIDALPQTDHKKEAHILKARTQHARSHMTWSNKEDQILVELHQQNTPPSAITKALKRSSAAIEARITILNDKTQPNLETRKENNSPHPSQTHRLLQYWRNALADASKMGLPPREMQEGEKFPFQDFKNGHVCHERIKRFFDDAERELREKNKRQTSRLQNTPQDTDEEHIEINQLQVILAPYSLSKNHSHGTKISSHKSPDTVLPLWIVANLTKSGELLPTEENTLPWIERKCLTPNENNDNGAGYPTIGDVSELDAFYTQEKSALEKPSWKNLFSFSENLLHSVLKTKDKITEQSYTLNEMGYILPTQTQEAEKGIISIYDKYISNQKRAIPPLLQQFCELKDSDYLIKKPEEDIFLASENHLGQMQNAYPLSASQRLSLSYFFDQENNDIFTVNGPPGTGKTDLLLSIIASKWVDAALNKKAPPIIVASSTNNQAVTNILNRLKRISHTEEKDIPFRWLPDFTNLGLYLTSQRKVSDARKSYYLYRSLKEDNINQFYTVEYKKQATSYFFSQFNLHFKQHYSDLKKCSDFIHEKISEKCQLLKKVTLCAFDFFNVQQKIIQEYGDIDNVSRLILKTKDEQFDVEEKIKPLKYLRTKWFSYKTKELKWLKLFRWLPFVNSLLVDKIQLFTSINHEFFPEKIIDVDLIDTILEKKFRDIALTQENLSVLLLKLNSIQTRYNELHQEKTQLESAWLEFSTTHLHDFSKEENVLSKIDKTIRYDLFILAMHYWEAKWLEENTTISTLAYNKKGRRTYWETLAMLTPCFVTTLHSGMGFFQHKNASQEYEALESFIDLFIIDEAGQVHPAIAGAMVSIAKKILIVGDTQQIEPIAILPPSIDLANAKKFKFCANNLEYFQFKNLGILCSSDIETGHSYGNVVTIGQRKAKYHLESNKQPGMLLKEHRRCSKEIISFCNELCYDNQLIPMTVEEPSPFPRMGYAHIKGKEEKNGSSRSNKNEAQAIAAWVAKNKNLILETCATKKLDDCIGIVTPFTAQKNMLLSALHELDINLNNVGTVHTFQGAEKPIIIFSPVYTDRHTGNFFFDRSPNMLNVAVSRAKISFLVFGDMDAFDSTKGDNLPSSLLAKHLFAREENEITDIIQPKFIPFQGEEIQQITTLEDHRRILKQAFSLAKKELTIVSPFLRIGAINMDAITDLIKEYATHLLITIYTDPTFHKKNYSEFLQAQEMLKTVGAMVWMAHNVHSKIIAIDDKIIVEGSFNWLSASRTDIRFIREESSILYKGKLASRFIQEALDPIKKKAKQYFGTNNFRSCN